MKLVGVALPLHGVRPGRPSPFICRLPPGFMLSNIEGSPIAKVLRVDRLHEGSMTLYYQPRAAVLAYQREPKILSPATFGVHSEVYIVVFIFIASL